jgi:zinc transport system permease protein
MDDFLRHALLGGLGVALAAGPVGSIVVWRRMAYFGDALAHAALLGAALGLWLHTSAGAGVLLAAAVFALLLYALQRQTRLPGDTLLGILSHTALAAGLVAAALLPGARSSLLPLLTGDLLALDGGDVAWSFGMAALALAGLWWLWTPLLNLTLHEDLAQAEGVPVARVKLAFTLIVALLIAAALKLVGALLITALLIIPAAAARRLARSPESMAVLAALLGMLAVALGLLASWLWDWPSGPAIVLAASALFLLALAAGRD